MVLVSIFIDLLDARQEALLIQNSESTNQGQRMLILQKDSLKLSSVTGHTVLKLQTIIPLEQQ